MNDIENKDVSIMENFYDKNICTCKDTCSFNCKGKCGCKACQEAYADYLTEDYE